MNRERERERDQKVSFESMDVQVRYRGKELDNWFIERISEKRERK